mmetsp:Transcript_17617/g.28690  ORF Transcript_17617/g.28690 Transcript_17617/m.28690 type:complete len:410 (-) Transcript_17617:1027-2256(-)
MTARTLLFIFFCLFFFFHPREKATIVQRPSSGSQKYDYRRSVAVRRSNWIRRRDNNLRRSSRKWKISSALVSSSSSPPLPSLPRENGGLYPTEEHVGISIFGGLVRRKELVKILDRDGAVKISGVFDRDLIRDLRKAGEKIVENGNGVSVGFVDGRCDTNLQSKFLQFTLQTSSSKELLNHVRSNELSALAASLLAEPGDMVAFHSDDLFVKEVQCTERTEWHRDIYTEKFSPRRNHSVSERMVNNRDVSAAATYHKKSRRMINIWIPLGSVKENDSIRILSNSHSWENVGSLGGQLQENVARAVLGHNWRENLRKALPLSDRLSLVEQEGIVASFALELIEDALGKEEFEHYFPVLQWNLEEGDAVIFHRQALHSSYGNTDSVTRMALSTRWGTEARLNLTLKARYSQ